ncbi:MAG: 30S ribosomal protein S6 [Planctomycetota bacterium]|jgi:small subunit ribosomal protein S6|nr:30S ribosomal protein S6 [Planctomycetota bacterium]
MSQTRHYRYEAMILLGQAVAADLTGALAHINEIFSRGHANVIAMRKWDDRRLAYEIAGQKRGLYILAYFEAPNDKLEHIERDFRLSEKVLRSLILRADHMTLEQMQGADGRTELEAEAKLRAANPAAIPAPTPVAQPAAVGADDEI